MFSEIYLALFIKQKFGCQIVLHTSGHAVCKKEYINYINRNIFPFVQLLEATRLVLAS